jgi:hypothetical protein
VAGDARVFFFAHVRNSEATAGCIMRRTETARQAWLPFWILFGGCALDPRPCCWRRWRASVHSETP